MRYALVLILFCSIGREGLVSQNAFGIGAAYSLYQDQGDIPKTTIYINADLTIQDLWNFNLSRSGNRDQTYIFENAPIFGSNDRKRSDIVVTISRNILPGFWGNSFLLFIGSGARYHFFENTPTTSFALPTVESSLALPMVIEPRIKMVQWNKIDLLLSFPFIVNIYDRKNTRTESSSSFIASGNETTHHFLTKSNLNIRLGLNLKFGKRHKRIKRRRKKR